jgi:hypothetical protein
MPKRRNRHIWTAEHVQWLRENSPGWDSGADALADAFNLRFGTQVTKYAIQDELYKLRLRLVNRALNKIGDTRNDVPIGSESVRSDGFIWVKVKNDKIPGKYMFHKNYRRKHHVLYEQYHGCKLSKDDCVLFLDGDKSNFAKDNLYKCSRSESAEFRKNQWGRHGREFSLAALTYCRLKEKLKK